MLYVIQILAHANISKSTYLPQDTLVAVVTELLNKHNFPFRPNIMDDLMLQAALDDKETYYDPDMLRHAAVNLLKAWKRQLLLLD